jgi:hypothetical protein
MVELYYNVQSDNGQLTDGEHIKNEQRSGFIANQDTREAHALRQWSTTYLQSLGDVKDLRVPLRLQNLMREAGFVDTEQRMIPMHTCGVSLFCVWCPETRRHFSLTSVACILCCEERNAQSVL